MDEHEVRKKKNFFSLILIRWRKRFRWPATTMAALPNMAVLNELSVLWNHVTSHTLDCRATKASWNSSVPAVQLFLLSLCVCMSSYVGAPFIRSLLSHFFLLCVYFFFGFIHRCAAQRRAIERRVNQNPTLWWTRRPDIFSSFFFVCVFCCLSVSVCVCVCVRWVCVLGGHTHTHTHTQKHVPEGVIVQRERERECHSNEPLNKIIKKKRKEKKKRQKKKKERRETRLVS